MILFIISTNLTYSLISEPTYSYPTSNNSFNLSINAGGDSNIYIFYKPLDDFYYRNKTMNSTIEFANEIKRDSSYSFYFYKNGERFPTGDIIIPFSRHNELYKNIAEEIIKQDPPLWYCNTTNNDYGCEYENMQGFRALSFSEYYHITGNSSYENITNNLFNTDYESIGSGKCNPSSGDYDCGYSSIHQGIKVNGSMKQGVLIYTFWSSYQHTRNSTIYELATNFTNGHAVECDVWIGNYDCKRSDEQGVMILGYWKAYEMTNNATYKAIAEQLTNIAISRDYSNSSYLLLGYWKAYEMSNMSTYLNRAINLSDEMIDSCIDGSCTSEEKAINIISYLEAYKNTNDYNYMRASEDKIYSNVSSGCNPIYGNFSCLNALDLSLYAISFTRAYNILPSGNDFFNPTISRINMTSEINISVKFRGNITEPMLYYKHSNDSIWNVTSINKETGIATIISDNIKELGIYEYKFNDTNGNVFPRNGSFRFSVSEGWEDFREKNSKMLIDPLFYCDPFGTNPIYDDFSCKLEHLQGAISYSLLSTGIEFKNSTLTNISIILSNSEIDKSDRTWGYDRHQTCDPYSQYGYQGDFSCNPLNNKYPAEPRKESGAVKQAIMIKNLISLYEYTYDKKYLNLALNYIESYPEECNIHSGIYDCGDGYSQGLMIDALLDAYRVLNDERYLDISKNLVLASGYDDNTYAMGLWKLNSYDNNQSILDNASAISINNINKCINTSCDIDTYIKDLHSYWKSYEYSGDYDLKMASYSKSISSIDNLLISDCDPNNNINDYKCRWPDQQALFSESYLLGYQLFFIDDARFNITINSSLSDEVNYLDIFNITCNISNADDRVVSDIIVSLNTNLDILNISTDGIVSANNKLITFNNFTNYENKTIEWKLNATYGEENNISCSAFSYTASRIINVTNIGNIYNIIYNNNTYHYFNKTFTKEYIIENTVDFDIHEFNMTIGWNEEDINIASITSDNPNLVGNINNKSIYLYSFEAKSNLSINITYYVEKMSEVDNNFNITSKFKANADFNEALNIYSFEINITKPSSVPFSKIFYINATVLNLGADYNSTLFTLVYPDNFGVVSGSYLGDNFSSGNDSYALYLKFNNGTYKNLSWAVYAKNYSDINITLVLNSSNGVYYEYNDGIDISNNVSNNSVINPIGVYQNSTFDLDFIVINNVDYSLNDIFVTINLTNNFQIYELVISRLVGANYNDFYSSGALNLTDNAFNITILSGENIRMRWKTRASDTISTNSLKISGTSLEGFFFDYGSAPDEKLVIVQIQPPQNNSNSSGGSGGGGGGGGGSSSTKASDAEILCSTNTTNSTTTELCETGECNVEILKEQGLYIEYDYSDYDLYNELSNKNNLHNISNFDYNEIIFKNSRTNNHTYDVIECINATRKIILSEHMSILNITFNCNPSYKEFFIYDNIRYDQENVYQQDKKYNIELFKQYNEDDDKVSYLLSADEKQNKNIIIKYYYHTEDIKRYSRPIIFAKVEEHYKNNGFNNIPISDNTDVDNITKAIKDAGEILEKNFFKDLFLGIKEFVFNIDDDIRIFSEKNPVLSALIIIMLLGIPLIIAVVILFVKFSTIGSEKYEKIIVTIQNKLRKKSGSNDKDEIDDGSIENSKITLKHKHIMGSLHIIILKIKKYSYIISKSLSRFSHDIKYSVSYIVPSRNNFDDIVSDTFMNIYDLKEERDRMDIKIIEEKEAAINENIIKLKQMIKTEKEQKIYDGLLTINGKHIDTKIFSDHADKDKKNKHNKTITATEKLNNYDNNHNNNINNDNINKNKTKNKTFFSFNKTSKDFNSSASEIFFRLRSLHYNIDENVTESHEEDISDIKEMFKSMESLNKISEEEKEIISFLISYNTFLNSKVKNNIKNK